MASDIAVQFVGVSASRGSSTSLRASRPVLRNVNLEIRAGELSAAYGLRIAGQPRIMDLNLIYRALASGGIDVTAGGATSGQIASLNLVVLDDDRQYFPAYEAVPLVRADVLLRYPQVAEALRRLGGAITDEEMRRMNYAVDGEKQDPFEVARTFLDKISRF